jgi:endonuclease/exonuclease/phosphatase family metal-dependent hydrolase
MSTKRPFKARRRLRALLAAIVGVPLALLGLFALNGLVLASGEEPFVRAEREHAAGRLKAGDEVTVVAFNIAKAFVHRGGGDFRDVADVEARMKRIADVVAAEKPDLVFLSEAVWECAPCPVDQVARVADACGLRFRGFGENYNQGLPFFRIAGGNAILSRFPLHEVANFDLAGRKPFWVTSNNRRALFCEVEIDGARPLLLGAMHPDSFSRANNATQIRQILDWLGDRPALLAGDFNSRPHEGGMQAIKATGRFVGEIEGVGTLRAVTPHERIDYVLAPAPWEHLGTRVIDSDASDHNAVVARFRVR